VWLDAFRPFGPTGTQYAGALYLPYISPISRLYLRYISRYAGALPSADLAFLRAFEDTLVRG